MEKYYNTVYNMPNDHYFRYGKPFPFIKQSRGSHSFLIINHIINVIPSLLYPPFIWLITSNTISKQLWGKEKKMYHLKQICKEHFAFCQYTISFCFQSE